MTKWTAVVDGFECHVVAEDERGARLRAVDEYHFETGRYPASAPVLHNVDSETRFWQHVKTIYGDYPPNIPYRKYIKR